MSTDIEMDAAEYVLGTLDPRERVAFADRLRRDGAAAEAVAAWEARFALLPEFGPAVAPGAHVWAAIERALPSPGAKAIPFQVIDGGRRDPIDTAVTYERSRNRWRLAALLSGAIAASLAAFVIDRQISTPSATSADGSYIAAVNRGGDKPALLVRVDLKTRQVYVRPVAAAAPAGKSLELWYIGDNKPPRSMGVVDQRPSTLAVPQGAAGIGATFAVSVEPPGGSKTGGPTGPVVYSGELVKAPD